MAQHLQDQLTAVLEMQGIEISVCSEVHDSLEQRMAASTADYLWAGAHYPVYSICSHGPTEQLVKMLKPKLEKLSVFVNGFG